MSGSKHRINPHQIHHVQQPLLDHSAPHSMYHQGNGILNGGSPVVMEDSSFPGLTFPFGGLDQSSMMNIPDVGFTGHIVEDFSQHHGLNSNIPTLPPHMSAMSGPAGPDFGSEQGNRRTSLEIPEEASPTEHTFGDVGTDEFGLPGNSRADGTNLGGKNSDEKAGAAPAWSELKTKAGKERKRLPLACIACRRKKIRCSGEKPACKHCLRSRIPCVYKVTTRKAAPRTDYMAMLDKRLKRMEDRIIKIIPKPEQDSASSSIARAIVKPAVPGTNSGNKSSSKKRGAEEAFGPDLEAWAKTPPKVITAGGPEDNNDSEDNVLFKEGSDALPSKEIQEHLAEIYFDNVYGQAYHLLHKPSFMRKLKNNTLPPVLVLSVCAVAARFAPQPNTAGTARPFLSGEEWASHARDICTRRYEYPNTTVLTCLLILGLHEFGTCHGGRSWALGGQAIRMAFALQLHKDLTYDPSRQGSKTPLSFIDREIRRRIMWACFLMDRFNSSGSDRPMFIKEESIQIQLPVKESYFQLDIPAQTEPLDCSVPQSESQSGGNNTSAKEHMGVAAYTIRAIAIWGRIVAYLHQGGIDVDDHPLHSEDSTYAKLVHQVEDLQRTLPEPLQYSAANLNLHTTEKTAGQFLLMHLSIQQNVLFLQKAAVECGANNGTKDTPSEFIPSATAKTVVAANRISEILRDSEHTKCNLTAPFAGYCAFAATNTHILGICSSNLAVKKTAEINAGINIKFLRKTMRHWGMFHWMVENIRTQYRNALDASKSGKLGNGIQGSGAWPVLQYSDWFNRYPHGVSDFDVIEPTAQRRREKGADAVLEQKSELQSVEEYFTSLASPSSTEGRSASHGPTNKRKQSIKKASEVVGNKAANKTGEAAKNQSTISSARKPSRAATSRRSSSSLGVQTSGSGLTGFPPVVMSHPQTQPYTAMSPMSPVQASPFAQHGTGQSPFFTPEMLQMSSMSHQAGSLSQPLDQHLSFGYALPSGGQNLMDSNASNWQAKNLGDNGMLNQDQRPIKMSGEHEPSRHPQSQGQIASESLNAFNGSDLPPGWYMPFNMEPPAEARDTSHVIKLGTVGSGGHGAMEPFGTMFGSNGVLMPQTMDGIQHSL